MGEKEAGRCGECEFYGEKADEETGLIVDGCPWPRSNESKWCPPYRELMKTRGDRDEARKEAACWLMNGVKELTEIEQRGVRAIDAGRKLAGELLKTQSRETRMLMCLAGKACLSPAGTGTDPKACGECAMCRLCAEMVDIYFEE